MVELTKELLRPCWLNIYRIHVCCLRLAHHLARRWLIFFSTALESAQRDHTFEFHDESEPLRMAEEVGLRVTRLVCDAGVPVTGGRFLPRALGMLLRRR